MALNLPKAKKIARQKQLKIEIYTYISDHEDWGISWMCKLLEVSRAAYYKWKHRKPSCMEEANGNLLLKIKTIAAGNNSLFGKLAMTDYINNHLEQGESRVNHKRVYRLMCINDIKCQKHRYSHSTWYPTTPEETAENILNRDFNATKPNEKWCTDVTEKKVPGKNEKAYISTILDLYDRTPVAVVVSRRNDTALVNQTLEIAVSENPGAHPLFHSDRGFQYTRKVFKQKLIDLDITQSMSRVNRCIDNGPMEGFQGILKEMLDVLYPDISSYEELEAAIYGTIDYYLNEYPQHRFHGKTAGQVRAEALQELSPTQYPIPKNNRIQKYWDKIHELQSRQKTA